MWIPRGSLRRYKSTNHRYALELSEVGIWCAPVIFSLMLGASLRRLQLLGTGLARCLSNWPELRMLSRSLAYLVPSLVNLNQWPTLVDGGAHVYTSSNKRATEHSCRSVLQRLTELGEEDLLQSILEKLPPATLLQAARVRNYPFLDLRFCCLSFFLAKTISNIYGSILQRTERRV